MVTVELKNLILHGHQGLYREEQEVMNTFEVNLDVSFEEMGRRFEGIGDTISYASLFAICRDRLASPGLLLEKVCLDIIEKIREKYPLVRSIRVSVHKLHAPIPGFQGRAGVSLDWSDIE